MTDRFDDLFAKQRADDSKRAADHARILEEGKARALATEAKINAHYNAVGVPGIKQAIEYLAKQNIDLTPYKPDNRMPGVPLLVQYRDNPDRRFKISVDTTEALDIKVYGVQQTKGIMMEHNMKSAIVPFQGATATKVRDAIIELVLKIQGLS